MNRVTTILVVIFVAMPITVSAAADSFIAAVEAAGAQPRVAVHLGFKNAEHTVDLASEGIHLIHGISSDKELAAAAKRRLQRENLSERASVIWQDSLRQLPYTENLINLLVVENTPSLLSQGLSVAEIFRVLVPRGVAAFEGTVDPAELSAAGFTRIRSVNGWTYATKPRPAEMDDWSHLNYDASGSRVSGDRLIGPPTRLRWIDGPRWQTAMGLDNTPDAIVSANGRIFYNGIAADGTGQTSIVARDAYNGMLLWARAPAAVGHPASFLAQGDKLFCNLSGDQGGLAALSAATGETILKFGDNLPAATPWRPAAGSGVLLSRYHNAVWRADPSWRNLLKTPWIAVWTWRSGIFSTRSSSSRVNPTGTSHIACPCATFISNASRARCRNSPSSNSDIDGLDRRFLLGPRVVERR
jgi:hypothetical protein